MCLLLAAEGIGLVLLLDVGCEQAADVILSSLQDVRHMLFVFILLTNCTCQAWALLAWAGGPAGGPSWRALRLGRQDGGHGSQRDLIVRLKILFRILGKKIKLHPGI